MTFQEHKGKPSSLCTVPLYLYCLLTCCSFLSMQASSGKVYRPGQPKTRSRFSLRRLFYANPLLSPPFTAVAGSPGCFRRREKEGGAGAEQSSWRDNYSTTSSILPGRSSPPVFNDGTSSVSTNSVLRSRPEPYQYVRSLIKGKLKNKYIFLLRRVGWCKKFVLNG